MQRFTGERARRVPVQGAQRQCSHLQDLQDGRRLIEAFYLPGDIFGFEVGDEHTLSAEAIVDCQLCVLRSGVSCSRWPPVIARLLSQLYAMTVTELQRARNHVMLLSDRAAACHRVLLEMSKTIKRQR